MTFAIFFFASWLITALFLIIPKKLSTIENTFVFMIILIISINWSWIIYEEFKLVNLTEEPMEYAAFLLSRSIIIPFVFITQLNLVYAVTSVTRVVLTILMSFSFLLLMSLLSQIFKITEFTNWNLGYDALYYIFLYLVSYASLLIFRKLELSEVRST
ncbi:hypothetical protein [Halobacillus sp. Marseille-P3879]|uniref:hypothetical protein n=1 Tax=Halobacillus TaxID=45667 RepID=UPI000C7BFBCF|nr:hypothetical protein [Halobacillus sp. Marseille-P3879]